MPNPELKSVWADSTIENPIIRTKLHLLTQQKFETFTQQEFETW
jgi:hypothetical protein